MAKLPRIAITLGDPSGIGPEVVAKALSEGATTDVAQVAVVGNVEVLQASLASIGSELRAEKAQEAAPVLPAKVVPVIDNEEAPASRFPVGSLSIDSAKAAHSWIEQAIGLNLAGKFDAIATAPVNKTAFALAGIADTGHQEVLKRLTGAPLVATMLVSGQLRCVHLSTHKSLSEACAFVTKDNIVAALKLTDEHFRRWGFGTPRIGVAALNPHASDDGLIGREELDEIAPAIEAARAAGIEASGPHPADSVFNQAIAGQFDSVLVMYHDQGHIAIKVHGFEESISVNLGLPFVRTSVDHGTAFDIAGRNLASATSMGEAIRAAASLASGSGLT